jgi:hypothetical protein
LKNPFIYSSQQPPERPATTYRTFFHLTHNSPLSYSVPTRNRVPIDHVYRPHRRGVEQRVRIIIGSHLGKRGEVEHALGHLKRAAKLDPSNKPLQEMVQVSRNADPTL